MNAELVTTVTAERDPSNGQWLPGNRAAERNPITTKTIELRKAFLGVCTAERMAEVTRSVWDTACNDPDSRIRLAAASLLFDRLFGRPKESLEVTSGVGPAEAPDLSTLSGEEQAELGRLLLKSRPALPPPPPSA